MRISFLLINNAIKQLLYYLFFTLPHIIRENLTFPATEPERRKHDVLFLHEATVTSPKRDQIVFCSSKNFTFLSMCIFF